MSKSTTAGKLTEAAFQRMVIDLAKLYGWRVAHFRPGMNRRGDWQTAVAGDGAGFPDLIMCRGNRCIVAELKTDKVSAKATPEQREWLEAFRAAGIYADIWRPEQWNKIVEILR